MVSDKLSRRQVESVLRRATEIESAVDREPPPGDEELSVGELMRLGDEAGLRRDSILRALGEVRRGVDAAAEDDGPLSRTLGSGRILISREVPGTADSVRRAVERFLREQLMTIRRHHGDRIEWERAQGIWPGLIRSLDFSRRYALALVSRVETLVLPEGPDSSSVTFHIDLSELRRDRLGGMLAKAAAAFSIVGLGGAALIPAFGVADVVALAAGGLAAGGIYALERRRFMESRSRIALAPERFLDLLVHRRRRAGTPAVGGEAAPNGDPNGENEE